VSGLDLLEIGGGIVARFEDREAVLLGDGLDVVVVGRFVGRLPGRGVDGVERPQDKVGQDDGRQAPTA
jgi:hypothetical protein